jgi:hypothetical protein
VEDLKKMKLITYKVNEIRKTIYGIFRVDQHYFQIGKISYQRISEKLNPVMLPEKYLYFGQAQEKLNLFCD